MRLAAFWATFALTHLVTLAKTKSTFLGVAGERWKSNAKLCLTFGGKKPTVIKKWLSEKVSK
jgi:hypothetical protein